MTDQGAMPAYPCSPKLEREICANNDGYGSIGLTKREVFAMAAMQGILANEKYDPPRRAKMLLMAEDAVRAADALLAALSDQPTRQEE